LPWRLSVHEIPELGFGAQILLETEDLLVFKNKADFAVWIQEVPKTLAPVGQASAQAGSLPWRVLWMQKVHFSITPFQRIRLPR
jgi:hypothetical protein